MEIGGLQDVQLRLAGTQEVMEGRKGFGTEGDPGFHRVGMLGAVGEHSSLVEVCKSNF